MRAMPVVEMNPIRELRKALRWAVVSVRIRPFSESGLNETLSFAVGAGRVRSGELLAYAELTACIAKIRRTVAPSVVGEDAPDRNAEAGVIRHSRNEKGHRWGSALIRLNLRERNPGVIINRHVQKLPADSGSTLTPVSGDAMANDSDSGQLLDIQMKQISWWLMLVALNGRGRLERLQPV
jgi:hypothetical protein